MCADQVGTCTVRRTPLHAAWMAWFGVSLCIFLFFVGFHFSVSFSFPFHFLVKLEKC
jgi:hypothetical protein